MPAKSGRYFLVRVNTGTEGTPVWTAVGSQRDATLNRSKETIDLTTKSSTGGWVEKGHGLKEWSIEFDALFIESDAGYAALKTAFTNDTDIMIQVFDGTDVVEQGKAIITDFPVEFPYEDAATYSVSAEGNGPLETV